MQNVDVMAQIKLMLNELKDTDDAQHKIILDLLKNVFLEYNTGTNRQIEKKLYDMIDTEVTFKTKKKK